MKIIFGLFLTVNKTIGLLKNLQTALARKLPVTIYKSFIRLYLDYGDDQVSDRSFHQSFESLEYNVAVAVTGQLGDHHLRSFFKN